MRAIAMILAAALSLAACGGDEEATGLPTPTGGGAAALPEWVERVYPPPGSDALPTRSIQVNYDAAFVEDDMGVRLIVDGTDVTTYADTSTPGVITYNPTQSAAPPLTAGTHTAEVRRVRLVEFGGRHEILDRFSWSFTFR